MNVIFRRNDDNLLRYNDLRHGVIFEHTFIKSNGFYARHRASRRLIRLIIAVMGGWESAAKNRASLRLTIFLAGIVTAAPIPNGMRLSL